MRTKYIYLNLKDLSEEARTEIIDMAWEEVKEETPKEHAENIGMQLEDLIFERVDHKLMEWSHEGLFVFNI